MAEPETGVSGNDVENPLSAEELPDSALEEQGISDGEGISRVGTADEEIAALLEREQTTEEISQNVIEEQRATDAETTETTLPDENALPPEDSTLQEPLPEGETMTSADAEVAAAVATTEDGLIESVEPTATGVEQPSEDGKLTAGESDQGPVSADGLLDELPVSVPNDSDDLFISVSESEATAPTKTERTRAPKAARFDTRMRSAIEEEGDEIDGKQEEVDEYGVRAPSRQMGAEGMGHGGDVDEDEEGELEEEALPKFTRQQMIEQIQLHMAERDALKLKHQNLEHKLALYFQSKRAEDRTAMEAAGEGEQKYLSLLVKYAALVREKNLLEERIQDQIDGLAERREQVRSECDRLATQLRDLQKSSLTTSVSLKTGRAPKLDEVEPKFHDLAKKDKDINKLMIENIIMSNRIHKIQETMKAKDQLGEGLHMIDFEQLKIENQTYNEKIEERNEDIAKLRKKITTGVEVLTHMKEKLEYLHHENDAQRTRLEAIDKSLSTKRTNVNRLKHSRDSLKTDNERLRHSAGLLGKNDLLRDFEEKVDEDELLSRRLKDLQMTYAELSMANKAVLKKVNNLKAANPTLLGFGESNAVSGGTFGHSSR